MGHGWRDLYPEEAAAHDEYWGRVHALQEKFKDVSLSQFTVGELGVVMRLQGLQRDGLHGTKSLSESDFKILEAKIVIPP